jgi:hypothetical protein
MYKTTAAAALLCLTLVGGCGDRRVSLPTPVPASGKVTLANGEPVRNVIIAFEAVDAMAPAACAVKEDGSFALHTYENKPGACPGKYRVVFRADPALRGSGESIQAIPRKYTLDNSPLEVEVPSGGRTDFELTLDAR